MHIFPSISIKFDPSNPVDCQNPVKDLYFPCKGLQCSHKAPAMFIFWFWTQLKSKNCRSNMTMTGSKLFANECTFIRKSAR